MAYKRFLFGDLLSGSSRSNERAKLKLIYYYVVVAVIFVKVSTRFGALS